MKKLLLSSAMAFSLFSFAQTNIATYAFSKSTGATYTPITGGTKIFPSGTNVSYDDEVSSAIALPLPFTFGGVSFTSIYVSTNGFISFGAAPSSTSYTPLSTVGTTTGVISAFGQDGGFSSSDATQPPGNHEVRYQDVGSEFVIQWQDHANYDNRATEKLNFQIRLNYATGAINIIYGNCTNPGMTSTSKTPQVGIRGNSNTFATNVQSLMIGNVPSGTTCDWSKAVTGNANSSNMLFSGNTNVNVKIPNGLMFTWTPSTQLPVRTFTATNAITSSGATINWTAPAGATGYNVQYRVLGDCDWNNFTGNPVSTNSAALTGLTQGTTYQVQVQALNGAVQAMYSHIPNAAGTGNGYASAGSFSTPYACPSTVTGLSSSAVTVNTATISWTASTSAPANGYEYYYSTSATAPTMATVASGSVGAGVTTANLAGLVENTKYYYWIRGNCDGVNKGVWSSSANFTTPYNCLSTVSGLASSAITFNTATISWTASTNVPANGYEYYYSTSATAPTMTTVASGSVAAGVTTADLTGLLDSTKYYYWVRGNCDGVNKGAWSGSANFSTPCPAMNVPYTQNFDGAVAPNLPGCTSSQNVGQGNSWDVSNSSSYAGTFSGNFLRYLYSSTSSANTWFYLAPLNLIAGQTYNISYKYVGSGTTFVEKFKVAIGDNPSNSAMTNVLADYPNVVNATPNSVTLTYTPTVSGVYYIGFNCYSDADMYYLSIDEINVTGSNLATNESIVNKGNIKLYPNPFSDYVQISEIEKVKSISVMDTSGKIVKSVDKLESRINLSELNSGMYIVVLTMKDGTKQSIKAIKK